MTLPGGPVMRRFESHFLGPDHEMNDTVRCGDEEAVEIFAQLLDFVAARDAVNFQKWRGRFGVVRLQFQPDFRMTQVRYAIDPEPVGAELKNAAVLFLLDQGQPQGVAIKGNGLLVRVARALDRDVRTARKLRPF